MLKPLVIGRYARPRCFKGMASLPCDYRSNSKAWMTQDLFREWLLKMDEDMARQNRSVLLIVDNCSAHVVADVRLDNIRLELLPPNCTSLAQLLDLDVIQNIKWHLRKRHVQRILVNIKHGLPTTVNVRQAAEIVTVSWWSVTQQTIVKCWRKAGFPNPGDQSTGDVAERSLDDGDSHVWQAVMSELETTVNFTDYVNFDSSVYTCAPLTTEEIIESVSQVDADEVSCEEEREVGDYTVSCGEVLVSLDKLRKFVSQQSEVPTDLHTCLSRIDTFLTSASAKLCVQRNIIDSFDC